MTKTETLSTLRTELRNARSAIDAIRHQSDERLLLLERYALENAELTAMLNDLFMWRREMKEKLSAIIIRNVPESVRRELKARTAKDGKTMRGVILELIARYVAEKQGQDTPLPGDRGTYTPKTDYPLPSGGGYLVARGK